MKNISVTKILKEQDEAAIITIITAQLKKLVRLYQIPNIAPGADVELADWIYENYKWEEFAMIYNVLKNPPATTDKNWRLTPDTIRDWMSQAMEDQAIQREREHDRLKNSDKNLLLFADDEEMQAIYEKLKMPGRLAAKAKLDLSERYSPRKEYICKGKDTNGQEWEVTTYAINEEYAAKDFKSEFGNNPESITPKP